MECQTKHLKHEYFFHLNNYFSWKKTVFLRHFLITLKSWFPFNKRPLIHNALLLVVFSKKKKILVRTNVPKTEERTLIWIFKVYMQIPLICFTNDWVLPSKCRWGSSTYRTTRAPFYKVGRKWAAISMHAI